MVKKKKDINLDENISIEEIDEEMKDFYIDEEKINSIKYDFDKDILIKTALDKADKEITKDKFKKMYIKIAASIVVLLSIGVYNPALAHSVAPLMKVLVKINDTLKVDEISTYLKLDTLIPKAVIEDDKIEFFKMTSHKVDKSQGEVINDDENNDGKLVYSEYGAVNFIHEMSNKIINAKDGKKYGIINITPKNIQVVLDSLENISDKEAKEYLTKALNKWKNGEFDNAVEVHNYVWHMLDGQIGMAISLDHEEINKIKNKYFK